MGYYTQYLSTILKGPWATSIKERIEARRAISNLAASDKKIYKQLPELVEKGHRVTTADKVANKVILELKKAAANTYALAFNEATLDMQILEASDNLIQVMSRVHQLGESVVSGTEDKRKIEELSRLFVVLIQNAIKKAKKEERWEYKYIMLIVNQAKPGRNHEEFMTIVRTMFQDLQRQSRLAKFAIRMEIGRELRDIRRIQMLANRCKLLLQKTEQAFKSKGPEKHRQALDALIPELESIIKESAKDIEDAFYEAYLIKKRDFLLILKLMVNIEVLKGMNRRWVHIHFMPQELVRRKEIKLNEIQKKISKDFHTIAQALRISMVSLERLGHKAATT
ncbi:hypothetical protein HYX02_02620 [Candidatus Woesearchaeota archaeon]|nr:hypothetical protein [Candidatus Woesearchaeota archaeon]